MKRAAHTGGRPGATSPPPGPAPRQQRFWDARAAANFACGGAGSGLVVFAALADPARSPATWLFAAGAALVGAGLLAVWFEIGRPWRALHVFFNVRRSWMSREACAAALLVPAALAAALGVRGGAVAAAVLAMAFLYSQARILRAARGIPAWREPALTPLLLATGLAEGGGLFFAVEPWLREGTRNLLALFGLCVLARAVAWLLYRRRVAAALVRAPAARTALDRAGRVLGYAGTLAPLALVALCAAGIVTGPATGAAAAAAGVAALAAGALFKVVLVTRAGFTQGVALPHLPVRGQPRGQAMRNMDIERHREAAWER